MFERLYHHRSGNERSHNSRHDCGTQDAAERIQITVNQPETEVELVYILTAQSLADAMYI